MDLAWPCMDNLEEKLIGGSMISTQERQRCSSSLSHFSFDYKTVAPEVLGVQHFSPAYLSTSVQFSSATQSCPTLCNPMNCSTPGHPVHHSRSSLKLMSIELVMASSHLILCCPLLLLPPIPPSISLFQWVNSSHEVAKVLEFQL